MQKLLNGILTFRNSEFQIHKELFKELKESQKPHSLFITCCDSRIDPNRITCTLPGEMFIIRNIANLVPPYRETVEYVSTTSAIEYAVISLEVENIIICGHSNCGGCAACLNPTEKVEQMPHTKKWLELAHSVRERVLNKYKEEDKKVKEVMMEQANVIEQLKHLMTYPYIKERVMNGTLILSGWYYDIETGRVFIYNKEKDEFLLANQLNNESEV